MKLNLKSFNCKMDDKIEQVVVISTVNLNDFLVETGLSQRDFNPDFVNVYFSEFVFRVGSENWDMFVANTLRNTETKVSYYQVETPENFDINDYFFSNPAIINYILHPKNRNYNFLMESFMKHCDSIVLEKIGQILESPETSAITSFEKIKDLWKEINCHDNSETLVDIEEIELPF